MTALSLGTLGSTFVTGKVDLGSMSAVDEVLSHPSNARVAPLLAYTILREQPNVPLDVRARLRAVLHHAAAADALQTQALRAVLAALGGASIRALILKGAAHAQLGYARPELRPRQDDDVLVDARDFRAASCALEEIGYRRATEVDGARVTGQRHYEGRPFDVAHHVDLHARPINPAGFASLPAFDALWERRRALPAVGGAAPGRVDSLLLACAHRVAHHPRAGDALWCLDLHFLSSHLHAAEWTQLMALARDTHLARVVANELRHTVARCGTSIPSDVFVVLGGVTGEPSAAFLSASSTLEVEWLNFLNQPTFAARVALVAQHLMPAPTYMRARYGDAGGVRLAWLYGRRALGGGLRWIREQRRNRHAG